MPDQPRDRTAGGITTDAAPASAAPSLEDLAAEFAAAFTLAAPSTLGASGPEIPLRPTDDTPDQEQALRRTDGGFRLRNVTRPTLIPFLPDPGTATGAAVLIAPGGAFLKLSMDSEGADVAHLLRERGVAAFVLKYRLGHTGETIEDFGRHLANAFTPREDHDVVDTRGGHQRLAVDDVETGLALIRDRAGQWGLDPARVSAIGFSAGAYAVSAAVSAADPANRPAALACIYGGRLPGPPAEGAGHLPDLFTVVDVHDPLCAAHVLELISTWRTAGASVEGHIYPGALHGFGARATGTPVDAWLDLWFEWLDRQGLLSRG
ncbi:alpha/beta hydrolase [Nesterenkonia sp. HG001]|uniref:alpha/beta hydrolase n=1 Tax=Nesterenkonia sp. HG001 TaxID=2983207 RepID=UPI002AC7AF62|nr:alpha/beta hydrolase [Nesterenkonia sp. HG001]MDZ5076705.1 alpha/beta hydrolase [Nesterenkonia sp. HG001]